MDFRRRYGPRRSRSLAALAGALFALGAAGFVLPYSQAGMAALGSATVFVGIALFALGCVVAGAGLRPGNNALRGAVLGLLFYLAIGLAWAIIYRLVLWNPAAAVSPLDQAQNLAFVALTWPWAIPMALGWLGR